MLGGVKLSRSYRRPFVTQTMYGGAKWEKRQANKKVRRTKNVGNGKNYKRIYDSWNICDYRFYMPEYKKGYRK